MEELRNTLSKRIESNLIKTRRVLDQEIVDELINDPENWTLKSTFEDERFTSIEDVVQEHARRNIKIINQKNNGEISNEEASRLLASLEEEKVILTENENYPVWKAYNLLQSVHADMMLSNEFGF